MRGWDNVLKVKRRKSRVRSSGETNDPLPKSNEPHSTDSLVYTEENSESTEQGAREIRHLLFCVHGIGQKLSEKISSVDLLDDTNMLRKTLNETSEKFSRLSEEKSPPVNIPKGLSGVILPLLPSGSGIQVLPIFWRSEIEINSSPSDEKVDLTDITLETVPMIRSIANDLLLDVLLYLTPRYRNLLRNLAFEKVQANYGGKHITRDEPVV